MHFFSLTPIHFSFSPSVCFSILILYLPTSISLLCYKYPYLSNSLFMYLLIFLSLFPLNYLCEYAFFFPYFLSYCQYCTSFFSFPTLSVLVCVGFVVNLAMTYPSRNIKASCSWWKEKSEKGRLLDWRRAILTPQNDVKVLTCISFLWLIGKKLFYLKFNSRFYGWI